MDHGELIRAAQQGEREAFDELVRQTYVETFTLAYRLTGNEEDARDVAQDAYLRAWRAIGRFRGDAAFSTWMYRITANAASSHTQRRRRQRTEQLDDHAEPIEDRIEALPGPAAESAEALDRVAAAIVTLPVKLRSVVVLKDVYGLSHEEIAAELDISVAAAKVRLHRARRKLKDMLYEQGEEAHAV